LLLIVARLRTQHILTVHSTTSQCMHLSHSAFNHLTVHTSISQYIQPPHSACIYLTVHSTIS